MSWAKKVSCEFKPENTWKALEVLYQIDGRTIEEFTAEFGTLQVELSQRLAELRRLFDRIGYEITLSIEKRSDDSSK